MVVVLPVSVDQQQTLTVGLAQAVVVLVLAPVELEPLIKEALAVMVQMLAVVVVAQTLAAHQHQ